METVEREMNNSMQRYVDILSEAGFKAVFGEERNKDVLNMLQKYMIQGQTEGTGRNMNCRRCILSP